MDRTRTKITASETVKSKPDPNMQNFRRSSIRPNHVLVFMLAVTALGVLSFFLSHDAIANRFYPGGVANDEIHLVPLELPETGPDVASSTTSLPLDRWETLTVNNGDNFFSMLGRIGFDPHDSQRILEAGPGAAALKRLIPGQRIKLRFAKDELAELVYENDGVNVVQIKRSDSGFELGNIKRSLETRFSYASGVVDSSLFLAAQGAGLSVNLTMQLAAIFGWDIDFAMDLHKGDRFTVVYEELYSNGEKIRDGSVLAAEFTNNNNVHRAVRYASSDGRADYYTAGGQNLRKAFLRTPVDVSRISSGFGVRFHPILNSIKAHRGVDYAAPIGTPIRVTGDGKIAFRGLRSGYGKALMIDHGNGYQTVYAHMSQFRSDLKLGSAVKQGQVIGYVGQTGLATGPHLHYEFQVNGVHRDPLTIKLPSASPIAATERKDFMEKTARFAGLIDTLNKTNVALTIQ